METHLFVRQSEQFPQVAITGEEMLTQARRVRHRIERRVYKVLRDYPDSTEKKRNSFAEDRKVS